ncbi:LysM peptidoglycan-binding domain-containing protein [Arthrobacter citreus]|uniref:LysM peptidoglycan-binding domain-containing protein n=1 Tax=Arthrobacter citreus TaxID=1670 RepID=UPI0036DF33F4
MASRGAHKRRLLEDVFQAVAAASAGALMLGAGHMLRGPAPGFGDSFRSLTDLQSAAGLAAGCLGLLLLAWWTVGLGAAFLSAVLLRSGNRRAAGVVGRLSPGFLKRLAAAALGLQLAAAPLPALAAPAAQTTAAASISTGHPVPGSPAAGVSPSPVADPSWQLARRAVEGSSPGGSAASQRSDSAVDPSWKPSPGPVSGSLLIPGGTREAPQEAVTVTAGDTLWDLAAAQLGPLATDHEIAGYWPAWHELNRSVIGPDPHRLLPGQVLAVPPPPAL